MTLRGVTVVGSGYVGTVVAAGFAACGHMVMALEVDPMRLSALRGGEVPFAEPGLGDLVRDGLAAGRVSELLGPDR